MERYDYAAVTPEAVTGAMDEALAHAERLIAAAVQAPEPRTFEGTVSPLSEALLAVARADGIGPRLAPIHPDAAVREAGNRADERAHKWRAGLPRRDDLATAIRSFAATPEAKSLTGPRRRALDLWTRDIRRAGHELAADVRAEFAALEDRIVDVCVAFRTNLSEYSDALILGPGDLDGLSPSFVEQLPMVEGGDDRRLDITYSVVFPFLEQSTRRDLREAAFRRYFARAVEWNRPLVEELVGLRRKVAALMGRDSWSQYANETRMSASRAAVLAFIDRMYPPLGVLAAAERTVTQDLLRADGVDDVVQAWDHNHYHEQQRRALGLDFGELAAFLPIDRVSSGLFDILQEVFGVTVEPVEGASVWHPDVSVVAIRDLDSGEHLADVYLDLFSRPGKAPGGWMATLMPAINRPGSPRSPAAIQLVLNFAPLGSGPVLLQHDDVVGLFHEFGHVLEFGLSRAEGAVANDAWIELDFVEAPSQIMEHWAWSPDVLRRFARHHERGDPPPDELLERLQEARRLNPGTETLFVHGMRTLLDQELHGPEPVDLDEAERRSFEASGFPFPEGTLQSSAFAHIAGMYDAGFYSYLWAQVFGDDLFSAFAAEGILSAQVGRRYRATVLEPSWSVPGMDRVRNFLGREPSEQAFLERLGIAASVAPR
jgi:Zn-dependent oligopeptidase